MIGAYGEDFLRDQASEIAKKRMKDISIFSTKKESLIPKFNISEIKFGHELGRGEFCSVFEVREVVLVEEEITKPSDDGSSDSNILQDRWFIAKNHTGEQKGARYAVKTVMNNHNDPSSFVGAVMDLAIEARFLAVLNHPNILKMRAVSARNPYEGNYFILLDRLHDTLKERIVVWKEKNTKITGLNRLRDIKGEKKKSLWTHRLLVALDISSALKYLHERNIIYRDLKPTNIGFDAKGDVKLFDFGLARELNSNEKLANDLYHLSGRTGSLRYMAPEVAKEKPYNTSVDVYSFAILLWQICSLEIPFEDHDYKIHWKLVVQGGERPPIDPNWPRKISNLMSLAWSVNISERPSFCEIVNILQSEVNPFLSDKVTSNLSESLSETSLSLEE